MRKCILLSLVLLTSITAFTQDFSNKGKDFYLCFPHHVPSGQLAKLSIWITSDKASSGTITMANGAFSSTFNILANGLAEIPIPFNAAHITFLESSNGTTINILKKSIRIKVDAGKPAVVAYVQEFGNARSTATLLLPVNVLGKKYYSMNFNQIGGANVTLSGQTFVPRSQFHIIAVKDNTVVTVTPMKNGVKQTPFTFTLPLAGDMIQYQSGDGAAATQDLTGTLIESVASGSGGCLPIAVFSGSSNVTLGTQTPFCSGGSYDPLFQQLYPVSTWGKNFGFVPLANYPNGVPYRVMAAEDNTNISINGAFVATLNAGEIYPTAFTGNPVTFTQPTSITADKPICVAEYAQSSGCAGNGPSGNQGDPDMVLLNPIEQNISDITIFSTRQEVINSQWINVVMKTIATPSFRISRNGCILAPPNSAWQPFAALPGYSYLREQLPVPGTGTCTAGPLSDSYRLVADSGFNAIAYGLGTNETYAYSAGTYIKDLNSPGVVSPNGIENNKVCIGENFKIKIPLPYLADSIYWDLSLLPGGYPNVWTYYPPSTPDSVTGTVLKPIYWYSLPTNFSIAIIGTFPIKATTYSQNTDGCGSEQDVEFEVEITGPPLSEFTWIAPRCAAETAQFNDASTATNPFYKWWWDFDDLASGANNNALVPNPTHIFTAPGTYNVRYVNITTPGCVSDTITHQVIVAALPSGTASGTITACINTGDQLVTFTGTGGNGFYTFTYDIDAGGGPGLPITISNVPPSASVTIPVPTTAAGIFTYRLTNVTTTGSTLCTQNITGQSATVTVQPAHAISPAPGSGLANQTRCINNAIDNITYDLIGGATGATVIGLPAGVTSLVTGTVLTISGTPNPVFPGASATYNYTVNTTGNTCIPPAQAFGSIIVNADHVLTWSNGPTAQTVCVNTPISPVQYTLDGGATGVTITGLPTGVNFVVGGNTVTISGAPTAPLLAPVTYTYTINTTGNACLQAPPLSGTITVNPAHAISPAPGSGLANQTRCINNAIDNITYDLIGGATGATVIGLPAGVTSLVTGTVLTISGTPNPVFPGASATYNYTVNTTGNTCIPPAQAFGSIIVNADHVLTWSNGPTAQTVCVNTPISPVQYTLDGGATGVTITGLPTGVNFVVGGNTVTISGAPTTPIPAPVTYTYTINTTGNTCVQAPPLSGTITVNPAHAISPAPGSGLANQTRCINNAIDNITYDLIGGATGATVTGLPAGVTSLVTGTVLTISGTPNPVFPGASATYNYTVNTTGNTCIPPAQAFGSIIVNADHVLTWSNGPAAQTVCVNTPISPVQYTLDGGATGVTITGLPTGVNFVVGGNTVTISGAPTAPLLAPVTYTYTINTTGNACLQAPPLSGTITVNPAHAISPAPGSGLANQTRCINNAIDNITYDLIGGATGATVIGLPAGVTSLVTGTVLTISGTPNPVFPGASATYNYTVNTTGNTCIPPAQAFGSIIVNADHVLTWSNGPTAQTVCVNTPISPVQYTLDGGATGVTITGLPTGVNFVVGGNTVTISGAPTAPLLAPVTYTYTINTTGNACLQAPPLSGTITVNPAHAISPAPGSGLANQTRCINNAIDNITYDLIGGATGATVIGLPAGVTSLVTGTVLTISGTPNPVFPGASATYNYTVNTTGNTCIPPAQAFGSIIVNADHVLTWSNGPTAQTVCVNTPISPVQYTLDGGATGVTITGLPTGVNFVVGGNTVTISGAPTTPIPAPVTYTYTINTTGNTCVQAPPLSGTITVNPLPTATAAAAVNTEACQNDAVLPGVTFTGANGTRPYIFTYTINGALPALTISTTALNNSVTVFQSTAAANTFIYKLISVTHGSVTACSQLINVPDVAIKINPLPTATISGSKRVCINSGPQDITFTGAGGTLPYTFTYSLNFGAPQLISTTGLSSSVVLPASTSVAGPQTYTLLQVQDGSATGCNQPQSGSAIIDVSNIFPNPAFSYTPSVCLPNAVVQFQNTSGIADGSPMTFSWAFGDGSPNLTTFNATHQYGSVGPFNVILTATSNAGCVTATPPVLLNNIHPQPKADFSFSDPAGVCIQDPVTLTDLSDGKDGVITQWFWDLGDGTKPNTNPVTHTYLDTITYNVTLYTVNNIGCNSDTITRSFTVHPYPHVNAGIDRFILEGGQITLSPIVYGNDLSFVWSPNQYLIDNTVEKVKVNKPLTDMMYTLTVTARGGCWLSDNVFVKLLKFPVIPNTFTPNNDGIHDKWAIDYLNTYPDNRVQVFTRTGQIVFESRGYNTPWDGTLKGKPLPFDTYYYIIEPGNGRDPITGYVTILK